MDKNEMDKRDQQELFNAFENADTILLKKYITNLDKMMVLPVPDELSRITIGSNVRLYHVDKIVYDKDENTHDKLMTVYTSLFSNTDTSLIMILQGKRDGVNLYVGTALRKVADNGSITPKPLDNAVHTLAGVIEGNFPGTHLTPLDIERQKDENGNYITDNAESVINNCFKEAKTITAVSGIAQLRNKNEHTGGAFIQGMEKLIDSMRGKSYTAVYIADLMSNETIETLCSQYEDIYSQLSPFQRSIQTLSENHSQTVTDSIVKGVVDTTNESLAKSVTHGTTHGFSKGKSSGWSLNTNIKLGEVFSVGGGHHRGKSEGENHGISDAEGNTVTSGKAKSLTEQNSVAKALMSGQGESLQITYDNRAVKTLLERIDEQIKRLRSCEDFGLFDSCVYFISDKYESAVSAASTYKSLIRGEGSSVESSALNVWVQKQNDNFKKISSYLQRLYHPLFALPFQNSDESDSYLPVSPALMISGAELAYQFSLPKKSVEGLPVIKCAEFGRNVMSSKGDYIGNLKIGNIYHMHQVETNAVKLATNDLTAHTFITGSTGAGKSNTIYTMLDRLSKENVRFLVIEPAKGEYKSVFGGRSDVSVYGTNPNFADMNLLRLNPFSFPRDIHVLEHIDRLVEIFNVCWPMYAAMPAILKDSVERAYAAAGWDLMRSKNRYDDHLFPTFADVLKEIKAVLDESDYSADNKGDYTGSLVTRIKSLTNGINGLIFTADDISDEQLFDENVIIDLSRVGSTETKALIMGILVLKLQEHRMDASTPNSDLKHVTVLEEAHNLLKRTSTEQVTEGANLLGKSVEMLANSIAEMRTYGEGFIIADQSPGLLDMSVIRNTNTKIIMRLPDYADRELVGKAAGLNDNQIEELTRLEKGVAAIYQNEWLEPVLCKVDKFESNHDFPHSLKKSPYKQSVDSDEVSQSLLECIMTKEIYRKGDRVDIQRLKQDILMSKLDTSVKCDFIDYITADTERAVETLRTLVYDFLKADKAVNASRKYRDLSEWVHSVADNLSPSIKDYSKRQIDLVMALLIYEQSLRDDSYNNILCRFAEIYQAEGGVF